MSGSRSAEDQARNAAQDRALRGLARPRPDPTLQHRVHQLARAQLDRGAPDRAAGPVRRLAAAVAPALLALVVVSYFGWSVCFLLASRMALPG
jgi:hypothetical protein